MSITYDAALNKLAEKVADRTTESRQNQLQRRNQVVDSYGMEFTRQGDTNHPAVFYISISPDLIYYERFEFKLIIQPFVMPVRGNGATGSTQVQVHSTSLNISSNAVVPNPHNHTTAPHNHTLDAGMSLFSSNVSNFEIWIEGINVTPYLKAQHKGAWINGEGIFPEQGLANYDLLKAVGYMPAWQQGAILTPGYKKVELKGTGVFNATFVNYLKYSHVNR